MLGFESMVKDCRDWEFVMGELWDGCAARASFTLSSSRVTP